MNHTPKMNLKSAWSILGRDSNIVLATIAQVRMEDRGAAADKVYLKAKKIAAKVAASHHPDVGGDEEKYKRVWEALESIKLHTEEFKMKLSTKIRENELKNQSRIRIEFGK